MNLTIKEAAERLRRGEAVAFPTETVYGLGANALDADAVAKVYQLKGRPATSPLIVHVDSVEMARTLVTEWPPLAEQLARKYWPGPLTMVLPKQSIVPDMVTAGLGTVGIRVPGHPVALELIREAGIPLAAPSANKFTGISPTTAEHVREAFGDSVPVVDGGACEVGIESTVVAVDGDRVTLLRPGMVDLGPLPDGRGSVSDGGHAAPGMHARHYSPRTPVVLMRDGVLPGADGAYVWYRRELRTARTLQLPADSEGYAAQLYAALHQLDREGLPWIAIEAPPETSEWSAIWDRLTRAASK